MKERGGNFARVRFSNWDRCSWLVKKPPHTMGKHRTHAMTTRTHRDEAVNSIEEPISFLFLKSAFLKPVTVASNRGSTLKI